MYEISRCLKSIIETLCVRLLNSETWFYVECIRNANAGTRMSCSAYCMHIAVQCYLSILFRYIFSKLYWFLRSCSCCRRSCQDFLYHQRLHVPQLYEFLKIFLTCFRYMPTEMLRIFVTSRTPCIDGQYIRDTIPWYRREVKSEEITTFGKTTGKCVPDVYASGWFARGRSECSRRGEDFTRGRVHLLHGAAYTVPYSSRLTAVTLAEGRQDTARRVAVIHAPRGGTRIRRPPVKDSFVAYHAPEVTSRPTDLIADTV